MGGRGEKWVLSWGARSECFRGGGEEVDISMGGAKNEYLSKGQKRISVERPKVWVWEAQTKESGVMPTKPACGLVGIQAMEEGAPGAAVFLAKGSLEERSVSPLPLCVGHSAGWARADENRRTQSCPTRTTAATTTAARRTGTPPSSAPKPNALHGDRNDPRYAGEYTRQRERRADANDPTSLGKIIDGVKSPVCHLSGLVGAWLNGGLAACGLWAGHAVRLACNWRWSRERPQLVVPGGRGAEATCRSGLLVLELGARAHCAH
jgi:hypothetical protein